MMFKALYRENWTEADWQEDARRQKANNEVAAARRCALLNHGWELHHSYCSHDVDGEWAKDPLTNGHVSHEEAYRIQEVRKPGSILPWPTFSNDWNPPSTQQPIQIGEVKVEPMKMPTGLVFYLDYPNPFKKDKK